VDLFDIPHVVPFTVASLNVLVENENKNITQTFNSFAIRFLAERCNCIAKFCCCHDMLSVVCL